MLSVCVSACGSACLDVNQCGTNRNRCTPRPACTDLLMNPDRTPKTRSVWPTLGLKLPIGKGAWIGIFEPAEPHSPWDDCCKTWPVCCAFVTWSPCGDDGVFRSGIFDIQCENIEDKLCKSSMFSCSSGEHAVCCADCRWGKSKILSGTLCAVWSRVPAVPGQSRTSQGSYMSLL